MITKTKTTWRKVKLGEIADFAKGKKPQRLTNKKLSENFKEYILLGDEKFYTEPDRFLVDAMPSDILIVADGARSGAVLAGKGGVLGSTLLRIRIKNEAQNKVDSRFLYFGLKHFERVFQSVLTGSAIPHIDQKNLRDFELLIPEDPVDQKHIANILSAFDDKIELNNKISKNLETMAQAIFKEWFVKFKFPDHKKAKFVDSELGKIPKGWEVKNLGDILVLEYGEALTSINRKKGVIPVYGSSGLVGYHDKKLVNGPGIIIGRAGIPGSVYWSQVDFHCVDSTFYVETKISKYFVFYLLKRQNLKSLISGSAVPGINRNIIYPNRIVLPLPSIINDFEKIMSPIFLKIYKNKLENQKLASLRDLLLPKLMSGKILVKS